MYVVAGRGAQVIALTDDGEVEIDLTKHLTRKGRQRRRSHKAGQQKNHQEPSSSRKKDQHTAGRKKTIALNRDHGRMMRDFMRKVETVD